MKARSAKEKSSLIETIADLEADERAVELGIWLSGIDSFILHGRQAFREQSLTGQSIDAEREFRIVQAGVYRCSRLCSTLRGDDFTKIGILRSEVDELRSAIREIIILGDAMATANDLRQLEFSVWSCMVSKDLTELNAAAKLIRNAELKGESFLPETVISLLDNSRADEDIKAELSLIVPRFAITLRWLSVVGRMLASDEPLKPSLLIFSRINEQVFELTHLINNRLRLYTDFESDIFGSLDAASYTAKIELKKVFTQELASISGTRPAPSVFARIETSYSLLYEGFQHMIAGFVRDIDPDLDAFELFPNLSLKRERSEALKNDLWEIANAVKAVEQGLDELRAEKLIEDLIRFRDGSGRFLFYKDLETTSRFIEEVMLIGSNSDLAPILHRFGAYLDTLYGQVQLRAMPRGSGSPAAGHYNQEASPPI